MWVQHYLACDGVRLEGLIVVSRCNANNDGIDIDGCQRVRIATATFGLGMTRWYLRALSTAPANTLSSPIASSAATAMPSSSGPNPTAASRISCLAIAPSTTPALPASPSNWWTEARSTGKYLQCHHEQRPLSDIHSLGEPGAAIRAGRTPARHGPAPQRKLVRYPGRRRRPHRVRHRRLAGASNREPAR